MEQNVTVSQENGSWSDLIKWKTTYRENKTESEIKESSESMEKI